MPTGKADLPTDINTELDSEIESETDVEVETVLMPNASDSDPARNTTTFAHVNTELSQEDLLQFIEDEKTNPFSD